MDLILCHTTADFDTLGAAVGLTRLQPGAKIILTGGCHPAVRDFLAFHRDEYPLLESRSVNPDQIRAITVVDAQRRDRLGKAANWLDLPHLQTIAVYDHHTETRGDIAAITHHVEAVGATTTLIAEKLQRAGMTLTAVEATVMALGIHVDTGSLSFSHATQRDALALAWLMGQGASLTVISDYLEPGLSPALQELLTAALDQLHHETLQGITLAWVLLPTETYLPGLSGLASQLLDITAYDVLLLAVHYPVRPGAREERLTIIGRAWTEEVNLASLFQDLGGGGHARAATISLRGVDPEGTLNRLLSGLKEQLPKPLTARELMSSPVRTIRPDTTIAEAQRILLRYGHSGLSVVDEQDQLVGVIARRDLDVALHHGFGHAPVRGYMTLNPKTITPEAPLPAIESLMVTYDIGRLPVLAGGRLVGIVTRTDVLRQWHRQRLQPQPLGIPQPDGAKPVCTLTDLGDRLTPALWELLAIAAREGERRGWHLYLVGGAVRDLLLADSQEKLLLSDIDLVVDGSYQALTPGAGVELAQTLQAEYPQARLDIHGRFQTAALLWHNDPVLGSLWIDIATARTEFYPYPAANPEVEASSIYQDLYRRDFTINALALRLTHLNLSARAPQESARLQGSKPQAGELLDFFGGYLDLQARRIRVLHANSFIEDPTRIYRAVRFAVRLGFQLEAQTEQSIGYAIDSGVYHRTQTENRRTPALQARLKFELKYILQAPYWQPALKLLANLRALQCLHPQFSLTPRLWWQLRLMSRGLQRLDLEGHYAHWQVRLEVLLTALPRSDRVWVATQLQLPDESVDRLRDLESHYQTLVEGIGAGDRPSAMAHHLRQYDPLTLGLLALRGPRSLRRDILHYLTVWSRLKPPLDGHDLKALGYKPGKLFRRMLDDLWAATLDGAIARTAPLEQQRQQALDLLQASYSPSMTHGRSKGVARHG